MHQDKVKYVLIGLGAVLVILLLAVLYGANMRTEPVEKLPQTKVEDDVSKKMPALDEQGSQVDIKKMPDLSKGKSVPADVSGMPKL